MRVFCSICKEIFIPYSEVKVTDCGHLYHGSCITRWTKQHRTCPQCRTGITKPFRVYFDVEKDNETDPSTLEHQVETLSDKLRETEGVVKNLRNENENYERIMEGMKECALSLREKNDILKTSIKSLKEQVTKLSKQGERISHLEREVELWKNKVITLQKIEKIIKGSVGEVNKMIENTPITELAVRQLCTYVGILKDQLNKNEEKKKLTLRENKELQKLLADERKKNSQNAEELIKSLKATNTILEKDLNRTKMLLKQYKKKDTEKNETLVKDLINEPKKRQPVFDLDLDILENVENESKRRPSIELLSKSLAVKKTVFKTDLSKIIQSESTIKRKDFSNISQWEELICAGPSRTFGASLSKSKSICGSSDIKDSADNSRSDSQYAFDGLGGRKKIRLGGPTPREEFEKLRRKDDRKSAPTLKHKTILDYCQLD